MTNSEIGVTPAPTLRMGDTVRGRWSPLLIALSLLLTCSIFGGAGIFAATRADAAWNGAGLTLGGVHVGTYVSSTNQSTAYCIEPDGDNPSAEVPAVEMSVLRGYRMQSTGHWVAPYTNEHGIRMMNYLLSTYGGIAPGPQWADSQAAAVALALWTIRGWDDATVANWVAGIRALAPGEVQQLTDTFLAEANTLAVPVPTLVPPSEPAVTWDGPAAGTVHVPAGYHQLRIGTARVSWAGNAPVGAQFNEARSIATLDAARSHEIPFALAPQEATSSRPTALFVAEWTTSGTGWPAKLWGFQPAADDADQLLLAGGGPESVTRSDSWRHSTQPHAATVFTPVVTTQVPARVLGVGEDFADDVTFATAGAAPWPQFERDGALRYRTVHASGTLYGPFASAPVRQDQPPSDPAPPIAATAEIDATDGPGTYRAVVDAEVARAAGYYTWVWEIDAQQQGPEIQTGAESEWHIAPDYRWSDAYGIPEETHLKPLEFAIATELERTELAPGQDTRDQLTLTVTNGNWSERSIEEASPDAAVPGALAFTPVPIVVRSTVYETDGGPEQQAVAPEDATVLSTVFTRVAPEPGADEPVVTTAVPLEIPFLESGGITVQTCVLGEDQEESTRELITDTCDDWGMPAESASVRPPEVTTRAQETAIVGEKIHDVASVSGLVPEGSSLGFTAYLRPEVGAEKQDDSWQPVRDASGGAVHWTKAEIEAMTTEERCIAQPVARTERVDVDAAGDVASPGVTARSAGTIYWVEDLVVAHPKLEAPVELHRGACGLPHETTIVTAPKEPPGDDPKNLPRTGSAPILGVIMGAMLVIVGGAISLRVGNKQILRRLRK